MVIELQPDNPMQIPTFWRNFLMAIGVGKAAIAGAGLTLAILGAFDIAAAVTAQHWYAQFQHDYLNQITAAGGVAGGIAGWLWNRFV